LHGPDFHAAGAIALEREALSVGEPGGCLIPIRFGMRGKLAGFSGGGVDDPGQGRRNPEKYTLRPNGFGAFV
jgi:hypothetical protein